MNIICGSFASAPCWMSALADVRKAIALCDWPHGTGKFLIYPESGKKSKMGNGVVPIRTPCIESLRQSGWTVEDLPQIKGGVLGTGDLDALLDRNGHRVGFEWETGNISSSHRAINKLLLTMLRGGIDGGILVVPSDKLKVYLTDRIGNIGELRPYCDLWNSFPLESSALSIIAVEQDGVSVDVPRIPKGTDGYARHARGQSST